MEDPEEEASDKAADAGQQPREEVAGWRPVVPLTRHSSYTELVSVKKNPVVGERCKQFENVEKKMVSFSNLGLVGIFAQGC